MNSIGDKIRMLRKNKIMTQEQLAEVLSVSPQSVSKWETGVSVPDVVLLPIIARYFGVTMDELFNYRLDALNYKERFVRFMVDNGVLKFGEFCLQSGRISPYFIDTGRYRSASQIAKLGSFYAECIREHNIAGNLLMGNTDCEIPLIISTSMKLYDRYGLDMNYGVNNEIGKKISAGDEIILIKDTLTSGRTLRETMKETAEETGSRIADIVVAVDRMERCEHSDVSARHEIEREFGTRIYTIVTLEDIIRALENGVVAGQEYLDAIKYYRERYGGR